MIDFFSSSSCSLNWLVSQLRATVAVGAEYKYKFNVGIETKEMKYLY